MKCQGVRQEEEICKKRGGRLRGGAVLLSSWPTDMVAWKVAPWPGTGCKRG